MTTRRALTLAAAVLALVMSDATVDAHDVAVTGIVRVVISEVSADTYTLTFLDAGTPALADTHGILPAGCQRDAAEGQADRGLPRVVFRCDRQLTSEDTITIPWKLAGLVAAANWRDGTTASAYFTGDGRAIEVRLGELRAAAGSRMRLMRRYFVLGAEHIAFGIDHLLFVLGLVLLVRGPGSLVKTITAFTIAHSLTLGGAVMGLISVDSGAVEATIALSIVLLAREVVKGAHGERHLVHRRPWLVAGAFGLLHGFGFAGALGDIGLRAPDIPLALLFFNLGVEAGQLVFVAALLAVNSGLRLRHRKGAPRLEPALGYALGIVATFWFMERL
jgi:hydrogenase/urease accessory protein HupE